MIIKTSSCVNVLTNIMSVIMILILNGDWGKIASQCHLIPSMVIEQLRRTIPIRISENSDDDNADDDVVYRLIMMAYRYVLTQVIAGQISNWPFHRSRSPHCFFVCC